MMTRARASTGPAISSMHSGHGWQTEPVLLITMPPRNLLNGGQLIVDYLVREGVPYVFGLCGTPERPCVAVVGDPRLRRHGALGRRRGRDRRAAGRSRRRRARRGRERE